jgi:hypothetical protein
MHRQLALLVLLTLPARITMRLVVGLHNHAPDLHKGVRVAATLAHWMMYVAIAGVILLGWALSSTHAIHLHRGGHRGRRTASGWSAATMRSRTLRAGSGSSLNSASRLKRAASIFRI